MKTTEQILEGYKIPVTKASVEAFEALEDHVLGQHDLAEIAQANLVLNSYLRAAQIYCTTTRTENFSPAGFLAFLTYPVWKDNNTFTLPDLPPTMQPYIQHLYDCMDPDRPKNQAIPMQDFQPCYALKKCHTLGICETYMGTNYENNGPLATYIAKQLNELDQLGYINTFPQIDAHIAKRTPVLLRDFEFQMGGQSHKHLAPLVYPAPHIKKAK